jgi:ketosteroid isomerase-like protein
VSANVERVREAMRLADEMRVDELVERFADGAVMELPFAPGKMPRSYVGKTAIAAFQQFARDSFREFSMTVDAIHETSDPRIVIAEHHSDAVVADNGRRYCNRYVTFFTFDDDGRIANWREYYDAGAVVRAFRPARAV